MRWGKERRELRRGEERGDERRGERSGGGRRRGGVRIKEKVRETKVE